MLSINEGRKKMGEYEVKKETKYEVDTHDAKDDVEDAGHDVKEGAKDVGHEVKEGAGDVKDKLKAGAKAVFNKAKDPDRDIETEYNKEKVKEKID
jgi:hypothetical protein